MAGEITTTKEDMLWGLMVRAILGGIAFNYLLWVVFDKNIPWYLDGIAGVVFSRWYVLQFAVAACVLRECNFEIPLWQSVRATLGV